MLKFTSYIFSEGGCPWPSVFASSTWRDNTRGDITFGTDTLTGWSVSIQGSTINQWECLDNSFFDSEGILIIKYGILKKYDEINIMYYTILSISPARLSHLLLNKVLLTDISRILKKGVANSYVTWNIRKNCTLISSVIEESITNLTSILYYPLKYLVIKRSIARIPLTHITHLYPLRKKGKWVFNTYPSPVLPTHVFYDYTRPSLSYYSLIYPVNKGSITRVPLSFITHSYLLW